MEDNKKDIETSYILREYFKNFKMDSTTFVGLKDKINKIDRNMLLDSVIKQDEQIYNLVAENYSTTIELFEQISKQINTINEEKTFNFNSSFSENSSFSSTGDFSSSFLGNFTENESSEQAEPISIKKLNENINQNLNKIQQLKNEIQAKNNFIQSKLNEIREDEKFVTSTNKEREIFLGKIEERIFYKFNDRFNFGFQYCLAKLVIEIFYEKNFEIFENSKNVVDENILIKIDSSDSNPNFYTQNSPLALNNYDETSKQKIFDNFKEKFSNFKEFIRKLKESHNIYNTLNLNGEQLKRINRLLEEIKTEAESLENNSDIYIQDNFFYPIFKSIKSLFIILQAKTRIEKTLEIVEKESDEINIIKESIKELSNKNSLFEKLKKGIAKKYENKNSKSEAILYKAESYSTTNVYNIATNSRKKESITQLKKLHNKLEHNYVLFLKNLSRVILKPKDLIRKPDPNVFCSKIK